MEFLRFFRKKVIILIIAALFLVFLSPHAGWCEKKKSPPHKTLKYQMLFFRNDDRIWVILPPGTTLVEIYPSIGDALGWVKAFDSHGRLLALDEKFNGQVYVTTAVKKPSFYKNKIVVTRYDSRAIGIYTPKSAAFVEIINAGNGFDGVVCVKNRKKEIIAHQSGMDICVTNLNEK